MKTAEELSKRSAELFPDNDYMQRAWYNAVLWLRNQSKVGFAIDKYAAKEVQRPLLHGYTAPEPLEQPMPEMRTVVTLPDDQVTPGVVDFKRKRK